MCSTHSTSGGCIAVTGALSLLRKLPDRIDITWPCGNHDRSAEVVSHLLGVTVRDEYILKSGDTSILVLHGHTFDDFLDSHPILTMIGDWIYYLLQKIDRSHSDRLESDAGRTYASWFSTSEALAAGCR